MIFKQYNTLTFHKSLLVLYIKRKQKVVIEPISTVVRLYYMRPLHRTLNPVTPVRIWDGL